MTAFQFIDMSREYLAVFLVAVICMLVSMEAEGQSTVDDSETCSTGTGYATSDQMANLIRKVDEVIASNQQPLKPTTGDASRHSLVSALVCEYIDYSWPTFAYLLASLLDL